jgi:hypothetical protein
MISEDGLHLTGGFVGGPQGLWTADPRGGMTRTGDLYVTGAKPTLKGDVVRIEYTGSYDLATKRWLPVRQDQVRPDGLAYTYSEALRDAGVTQIHLVSTVDGSDRVIYSGSPRGIVGFQPEGIYITQTMFYTDMWGPDLWRLDPATGSVTAIPNGRPFETIDHGFAWVSGGIMPRRLTRFDSSWGNEQVWVQIAAEEGWIWFLGFDVKGSPLVDLHKVPATTPGVLFVYTAPQVRIPIANVTFSQQSMTDSHGTWLAGSDGIYLLDINDRLVKVSDVTGGTVAGTCN